LPDEVARATGLGGRPRTNAGSSHERARVAVRKAISTAIERIRAVDGEAGAHLRRQVRTGSSCSYERDDLDRLEWVLD
jgi:hypothetical protein